MAFITDSSQQGPNGIIVVDLGTGESWRRLNNHPTTKPEELQSFLPLVEGRPFLEHMQNGSVKPGASMSADGIAISSDGSCMYYCPLGSRRLYSVSIDALANRDVNDEDVAATIMDHGDRGVQLMVLSSILEETFTQPTTSTMPSFVFAIPTACGKPWFVTHAFCGLTPFL
jgi:hypothetical protein